MTRAKAKATPFAAHVASASRKAASGEIAAALGKLVAARLKRHVRPTVASQRETAQQAARAMPRTLPTQRRSTGRRRGRNQHYTPTAKVDISRLGTFRHYMLRTIRDHSSTWDAERAHADSGQHVGKRLDFGWAAAEGYITFD